MQEDITEFDALLKDLTAIKAPSKAQLAVNEVMEIIQNIAAFQQNADMHAILRKNARAISVQSHDSSESQDPSDVDELEELLEAEPPQNAEPFNSQNDNNTTPPENLTDWVVIAEHSQAYLHNLLTGEKYFYFRQSPTPMSEILSLYFFLKSETLNPKSLNKAYQEFIQRSLDIVTNGSVAFVINTLPKITGHNYTASLKKADESLKHPLTIKTQAKIKLFKVIDRHLLSFTNEPLAKLDAYLQKKKFEKDYDEKFDCAQELRKRIYMHSVKCYYQECSAQDSIFLLVSILRSVCKKILGKGLHELDGHFSEMMLSILSHIDKTSTEHLLEPTNYHTLISATVGDDRYSNRVAHLSGPSFHPRDLNRFHLFNNASYSEFANQEADAFFQIMTAIENAERFIFMLDWEFSPQLVYHRKDEPNTRTLGEILIDKAIASPNLNIAIMVWGQQIMYRNIGAETHSQALIYLTEVAKKRGFKALPSNITLEYVNRPWRYIDVDSHHQKLVLTDQKQFPFVVGFLGGLDLTAGRFDFNHELLTQEQYLQKYHQTRDLKKLASQEERFTHADICNLDTDNPFRTPWHDIHCRVEGPICIDLLNHFRQHWGAHNQHIFKNARIHRALDYATTKLNDIEMRRDIDDFMWTTQLLRSHTRTNCRFWNLTTPYENSILAGYVRVINRAERFIYIENQYFIGGGKNVHDERRFGNLIPNAIFKKIIDKHDNKEDFHVIINLPLYPEGGPGSRTDNIVRTNQHNTMHWLIKEINKHTENQSHRYITFLWNGEWQGKTPEYDALAQDYWANRTQLIAASRRYPIYTHSKLIMADDKFVIIGSANINERSMMGIRDSEIAVLQGPSRGREADCRQSLLEFRTRVWRQYFGQDCLNALGEEGIANPQTSAAIHIIQQHARQNLVCFIENVEGRRPLQGHIMVWPYLMTKEFALNLKKLPDTPLSCASHSAYNWMLDKENIQEGEYTSILERWFRDHPGFK